MSGATARLRKDQQRALEAYSWAAAARQQGKQPFDEYQIAVQNFAATLLRSGLAAAVSTMERNVKPERSGSRFLLEQLAALDDCKAEEWPGQMRRLALAPYMVATRELVARLTWLRRACRALDPE